MSSAAPGGVDGPASRWAIPTDPETRWATAILFAALAVLVAIGIVFRDVNPG